MKRAGGGVSRGLHEAGRGARTPGREPGCGCGRRRCAVLGWAAASPRSGIYPSHDRTGGEAAARHSRSLTVPSSTSRDACFPPAGPDRAGGNSSCARRQRSWRAWPWQARSVVGSRGGRVVDAGSGRRSCRRSAKAWAAEEPDPFHSGLQSRDHIGARGVHLERTATRRPSDPRLGGHESAWASQPAVPADPQPEASAVRTRLTGGEDGAGYSAEAAHETEPGASLC